MNQNPILQAALFRSCLRKEYRDQVIKMLRGLNGEFTRTTYRLQWVEQSLLEALRKGLQVQFVGTVVDEPGTFCLPVRLLHLEECDVDDKRQALNLVLKLGDFVCEKDSEAVERSLVDLTGGSESRPPQTFVSVWADTWRELQTVDDAQAGDIWRRSIDFLTEKWSFEKTVFFRPEPGWSIGARYGPKSHATQSTTKRLSFDSYNPHLASTALREWSLISQSTGLAVGPQVPASIPANGLVHVDVEFLECGAGSLRIEVRPDPQWSTYIPVDFEVASDEDAGRDRIRLLGSSWRKFLQTLDDRYASGGLQHGELLDLLLDVFDDNPELIVRRGRVHLANSEYRLAADRFSEVLRDVCDPRAVFGQLIAALHVGDIAVAESALQQLDLSKTVLFEEMLCELPRVSGGVARDFCHAPGSVLSEAKAIQMLQALAAGDHAETVFTHIFKEACELNFNQALQMALYEIQRHPEWRALRHAVVGAADKRGAVDEVEPFIADAIRWRGEDPEIFSVDFFRLGAALSADVSSTLASENAARLFATTTRSAVLTAFELAAFAAETAFRTGNFNVAQRAIQMILANVHRSSVELGHQSEVYQQRAIAVSELIVAATSKVPGLAEATVKIEPQRLAKVGDELIGRVVVIFGGRSDAGFRQQVMEQLEQDWREAKLPGQPLWISWREGRPPSAEEVKQIDCARSILVVSASELGLLTPLTRDWLVGEGVPIVTSNLNFREVISNLSDYFEQPRPVVPDFQSCVEVITYVEQEMKNLVLGSQVRDSAAELDGKRETTGWARRVHVALKALNDYGEARQRKHSSGSFRSWASSKDKFPSGQIKDRESESTMSDPRLASRRVFKVPREVDQTGSKEMQSHIAIGVTSGCPRIYFDLSSIDQTGKICVGYVGPHLPTASGY